MSKTLDPNTILKGNKYDVSYSEFVGMLEAHGFVIEDSGRKRPLVTHSEFKDIGFVFARSGTTAIDAGAATDGAKKCLEVLERQASLVVKPQEATLPEWLEKEEGFEYEPRGLAENPSFVMWDKECPELVFEYNLKGVFDKKPQVLEFIVASFKEVLSEHKSKLSYIMENYGVNNDRAEGKLRLFNSSLGYQSEAEYCNDFTLFLVQEIAELEARWQLQEDELNKLFDKNGIARTESENGFTIIHKLHNNANPINIKAFGSMGLIAPEQMEAIRNTVVKIEQAIAKSGKLTIAEMRALAEDLITKHRPVKTAVVKEEPKPEPKKPEPLERALAEAPFKPLVEKPAIPFHHDFAVPASLFEVKPAEPQLQIKSPEPIDAPAKESTTPFSESSVAKIAPSTSRLNAFEHNETGYFFREDAKHIVLNEFIIPEDLKAEGKEKQVQEFINSKIDELKARLESYESKYGVVSRFNPRNGRLYVTIDPEGETFFESYSINSNIEYLIKRLETTLETFASGQRGYVRSIIGELPITLKYSSGKATVVHQGKTTSTLIVSTYGSENILDNSYFKRLYKFVNDIRKSEKLPLLKLPVHDFTNDGQKVYNLFPTAFIKEELLTPELRNSNYFMVESDHPFTQKLLDLRQKYNTQQQAVKATATIVKPATITTPQAVEPIKPEPTLVPSQEMHLPKDRPVNLNAESLAEFLKHTVHARGTRPEWLDKYVDGLKTFAETKQTPLTAGGRRSLPNSLIDEYAKSMFVKPTRAHKVKLTPAKPEKAMPLSPSLLASAAPAPAPFFSPAIQASPVVEPPETTRVEAVPTPVFVGAVTIAPTTTTIVTDPAIAKKLGDLLKYARADVNLLRENVAEKLALVLQAETKGISQLTINDYFSWEKGGEYKTKRAFPSRKELALFLDVVIAEVRKRENIPQNHEVALREGITQKLGVILDMLSEGEIPQDNSTEVTEFRKGLLEHRAFAAGVSEAYLVTEFNKKIPARIDTSEINADFIKAIEDGTSTKLDDKVIAALSKALNLSTAQTQEAQSLFSQIAKVVAVQTAPEAVATAPIAAPQPVIAPTSNIVPIAAAIKSQAAAEIESAMINIFAQITQSRKNIMQIFFSYNDAGSLRSFTEIAAKAELPEARIEAILDSTKPTPRIILSEEDTSKILNGFRRIEPQGSTARLRNSLKSLNDLFKDYNLRARDLESTNGRAIA